MTNKEIKKEIVRRAEIQLSEFKKSQNQNVYAPMTLRDFDVWCGGYFSAISWYYQKLVDTKSEEQFVQDIKDMSDMLLKEVTAISLGVTGTATERIDMLNIADRDNLSRCCGAEIVNQRCSDCKENV